MWGVNERKKNTFPKLFNHEYSLNANGGFSLKSGGGEILKLT